MKQKILIGHPLRPERVKALGDRFQVECIGSVRDKHAQVLKMIDDYDALFAISHVVDKAIMDKARHLKVISNYGVGYDKIDVAYAKSKGIAVTNTPLTTSAPTADFAMSLMLALMRKVVTTDRWIRQGDLPDWANPRVLGSSPNGKKLGIVGMGRIGKEVARRARVFGMDILYHNRNRLPTEEEGLFGATYYSLSELCRLADVISIHAPYTKETQDLIDTEQFNLMKPTAYLINTARGGLVSMKALIKALESGKIAGAALDVFPDEPHVPPALLTMDQVVLTPHNGTGTREARDAMFAEAFTNIVHFLDGKGDVSRVV